MSVHFNHWFKIPLSPLSFSHSLFSPIKISVLIQFLFSLMPFSCATKKSRGKKEKQNKTFKNKDIPKIIHLFWLPFQIRLSNGMTWQSPVAPFLHHPLQWEGGGKYFLSLDFNKIPRNVSHQSLWGILPIHEQSNLIGQDELSLSPKCMQSV